MTAAVYAADAGLSVTLIEKGMYGGQMTTTDRIENYPGFTGIAGWELSSRMFECVTASGISLTADEALSIEKEDVRFKVICRKSTYEADAVILANGVKRRKLGIPGELEFAGKGVSYCAVCDGNFFKGRTVAVVGGGNSALEDASYLAGVAAKVYLIHRRDEFRADGKYIEAVKKHTNIEFLTSTVPVEITGGTVVDGLIVKDVGTGEEKKLNVSGVFAAIGLDADNAGFSDLIGLTEGGYVDADEDTVTSCPGIFAAGDTRSKKLRQIVTACADGASAAKAALEYLN